MRKHFITTNKNNWMRNFSRRNVCIIPGKGIRLITHQRPTFLEKQKVPPTCFPLLKSLKMQVPLNTKLDSPIFVGWRKPCFPRKSLKFTKNRLHHDTLSSNQLLYFVSIFFFTLWNLLTTHVLITQKPVNFFVLQINVLVSIWQENLSLIG